MPELRRTTLRTSGWTLSSATKYTRSETTDVAWVLIPASNAYIRTPLSKTTSASDVPTTITGCGGTFHYDSGTDVLTVDAGVNLNSVNVEIIYDNTDSGILISGDGCRVDSLMLVGFGMDVGNEPNQNCCLRFSGTGNEACLFTNCKCYYSSTHVIAQYTTTSGGYLAVANCEYGWAIPSTSPTLLNSYAADGLHEFVLVNNRCIGAELPSGTTPARDGASVYGHTNGVVMASLYICQGQRDVTTATTPFAPSILVWGHPATVSSYTLTQYRAFWIDCDIPDVYYVFNEPSNCYINCTSNITPVSALAVVIGSQIDDRAYLINHRYVITLNNANTASMTNFCTQNAAATNDCHRDHCGIWYEGDTTDVIWWDRRLGLFGGADIDPRVNRNCVFINNTSSPNALLSMGNTSSILQGSGVYNFASSTDATVGYNQDPRYVTLGDAISSTMIPAPGHELATGGVAVPSNIGLEYDCLGRARDLNNVVRGPYATPYVDYNIRPRFVGVNSCT